MSVKLDLSFEIHDFDDSKRTALYEAATQFLADEGLLEGSQMIVDCLGQTGYVCGYTTSPIIISKSDEWIPEVTARWIAMAERVNGGPCRAVLEVGSADA